jgi:hypothetical protein
VGQQAKGNTLTPFKPYPTRRFSGTVHPEAYIWGERAGAKLILTYTDDMRKELAEEAAHMRVVEAASVKATEAVRSYHTDALRDDDAIGKDRVVGFSSGALGLWSEGVGSRGALSAGWGRRRFLYEL